MSVLIKGMEMPENCWDCPLESYSECYNGRQVGSIDRPEWCPLEEVKEEKEWALKTSDQKQTSR